MFSSRVARLIAGKIGYTASCFLAASSVGAMNILVMGLESRTNFQGQCLYFGATAKALASLPAQHVEVLLGTGSTVVPAGLTPTSTSSPSPSASPSASSSSAAANNGAAGGAVTVAANAKYGIPCVF